MNKLYVQNENGEFKEIVGIGGLHCVPNPSVIDDYEQDKCSWLNNASVSFEFEIKPFKEWFKKKKGKRYVYDYKEVDPWDKICKMLGG